MLISAQATIKPTNSPWYRLVIDGIDSARVSTEVDDDRLKEAEHRGFMLRTTDIYFLDERDTKWHIAAELPDTRTVQTEFETELTYKKWGRVQGVVGRRLGGRKISVHEQVGADEAPTLIATTRGDLGGPGRGEAARVFTRSREYPIAPAKRARRGDTGGAEITRTSRLALARSTWTVETEASIPLAAALIHWHILLGDFYELSAGGGSV